VPEQKTIERARRDKREGKSPSTQAGEFVREAIEHVREGKHGVRSTKQAIAIGLSQARRAGVDLPPPKPGETSEKTRKNAQQAYAAGHRKTKSPPSAKRSRATTKALKRESSTAVSRSALAAQARSAAAKRTPAERSASARKAAKTRAKRAQKN
jgi:hypothetical protein